MQISKNIVNGPKSNNFVSVGICLIVCFQKPSHRFCRPFVHSAWIVFPISSLYLKQLPLFCLLRLINASADRVGYITNFCSMIKLLLELKHTGIHAFDNVTTAEKQS